MALNLHEQKRKEARAKSSDYRSGIGNTLSLPAGQISGIMRGGSEVRDSNVRRFGVTMKSILIFLSFFSASFLGMGYALAATDETAIVDFAKPVFDAVMKGQFALAGALMLVLLVAFMRRYGSKKFPFFKTDTGGTLLTFLGSLGGAVSTALLAGAGLSFSVMTTAIGVAATASGGYTMIKRLIIPLLKMFVNKLPAKFQKPFGLILWIFESPKVAAAEKAGEKAVAEKPSQGLGSPHELP
jgi:hypothetical protein